MMDNTGGLQMRVYVDQTHLGRHVTGLERITLDLFSPSALAPLDVVPVGAHGRAPMVAAQTFGLPARLAQAPASLLLCPGFPPSPLLWPFRNRVIPYVHDVFLLTRRRDLNARARLYMAAPFRLAVRTYPRFLVNSQDTRRKLMAFCRSDADVTLYRPRIHNVFGLAPGDRSARPARPAPLRLVALGTVEPRKNFVAAARIVAALRERGADVTLDIVGRRGWGDDWTALERAAGVTLHGYQSAERVSAILGAADAYLCVSHEEGLGLPLLEAQYAGLAIMAPDQPVFHEVLGASGVFIDPRNPGAAADAVAAAVSASGWRARHAVLAAQNLSRWNALAADDRGGVVALVEGLARARHIAQRDPAPSAPGRLTRRIP
jgi:glycosyltransferase involved in cell wall biosynthesis